MSLKNPIVVCLYVCLSYATSQMLSSSCSSGSARRARLLRLFLRPARRGGKPVDPDSAFAQQVQPRFRGKIREAAREPIDEARARILRADLSEGLSPHMPFHCNMPIMLLIYPPAARSAEPPLGIARLAAFLKGAGREARCIDLCREGIDFLLEREVEAEDNWTRGALRRRQASAETLRDPTAYMNPDRYRRAVGDLGRALRAASIGSGASPPSPIIAMAYAVHCVAPISWTRREDSMRMSTIPCSSGESERPSMRRPTAGCSSPVLDTTRRRCRSWQPPQRSLRRLVTRRAGTAS